MGELSSRRLAIERELEVRSEVSDRIERRQSAYAPRGSPRRDVPLVDVLSDHGRYLGERRCALLLRQAEAHGRRLNHCSKEVLEGWLARIGDPFRDLDREQALRTLTVERDAGVAARQQGERMRHAQQLRSLSHTLTGHARAQVEQEIAVSDAGARSAGSVASRVDRAKDELCEKGGDLDSWMVEHGHDASLRIALLGELASRGERDLAPVLDAQHASAVERREVGPEDRSLAGVSAGAPEGLDIGP